MKTTEVRKIDFDSKYPGMEEISARMDKMNGRLKIDTINWNSHTYKPDVELAIGYSDKEIFLKYFVIENYFKAEKTESNQSVCEDSCVEFFVSPEEDGVYYNLEFNGIGTCLLGTGTARENSIKANPEIISQIRRLTSVGNKPVQEKTGMFNWTMTAAIPLEAFFHHNIKDLKGKTFRANFYKCGDKLTVPHYLTWNPVETEKPDYHQPAYFGLLKFI